MKTREKHLTHKTSSTVKFAVDQSSLQAKRPEMIVMTRHKKKQLLLAGGLALGAGVFLIVAPELGVISAFGGIGMGLASAVTTYIARH